ncbi:hypothetical protein VP01_1354g2 [Puccinia sorghi]|uniref:Uncharacterized protein n=1 Tax=Puccinia sorghi TaxID=27349 RepID=A0A0L6VM15_9BASI|nr:hypothetical protein VP01_1354g2 [Puccinia sorghi]
MFYVSFGASEDLPQGFLSIYLWVFLSSRFFMLADTRVPTLVLQEKWEIEKQYYNLYIVQKVAQGHVVDSCSNQKLVFFFFKFLPLSGHSSKQTTVALAAPKIWEKVLPSGTMKNLENEASYYNVKRGVLGKLEDHTETCCEVYGPYRGRYWSSLRINDFISRIKGRIKHKPPCKIKRGPERIGQEQDRNREQVLELGRYGRQEQRLGTGTGTGFIGEHCLTGSCIKMDAISQSAKFIFQGTPSFSGYQGKPHTNPTFLKKVKSVCMISNYSILTVELVCHSHIFSHMQSYKWACSLHSPVSPKLFGFKWKKDNSASSVFKLRSEYFCMCWCELLPKAGPQVSEYFTQADHGCNQSKVLMTAEWGLYIYEGNYPENIHLDLPYLITLYTNIGALCFKLFIFNPEEGRFEMVPKNRVPSFQELLLYILHCLQHFIRCTSLMKHKNGNCKLLMKSIKQEVIFSVSSSFYLLLTDLRHFYDFWKNNSEKSLPKKDSILNKSIYFTFIFLSKKIFFYTRYISSNKIHSFISICSVILLYARTLVKNSIFPQNKTNQNHLYHHRAQRNLTAISLSYSPVSLFLTSKSSSPLVISVSDLLLYSSFDF